MLGLNIRRRDTGDRTIPGINPILARAYVGRGLDAAPELGLSGLPHFETLMNVRDAAERLAYAIDHDELIAIAGDFGVSVISCGLGRKGGIP